MLHAFDFKFSWLPEGAGDINKPCKNNIPYFQEMAILPIFDQNVVYFLYFNDNNSKKFLIEQFDA